MKSTTQDDREDRLIGKQGDNFDNLSFLDHITLNEAIAKLPPNYRTVLILHDVMGLPHSEIASWLGCSEEVSKSKLHNGRMKLRKLLKSQS